MSIDDHAARSRSRQGGYTLLEVMITLVIITLMALVIERTLASTQESDQYMSAIRRAKENCERSMYEIYGAATSSRRIFERGGVGDDYLSAIDIDRFPIAPNARLPLFETERPLGPDLSGDPRTGNVLLLVRETDPLTCPADAAQGEYLYIDVYHFVCCYPHLTDRKVISDDPANARDLVIWYSIAFPSYQQVMAISDVDRRRSVARNLRTEHGCAHAWDASAPAGEAFYALESDGEVAALPTPDFTIPEHPGLSDGGALVVLNTQLAPTRSAQRHRRAVFTVDTEGGWKPNGFEVKVTGLSGHRKVWFHLVVEAEATRGKGAVHQSTMIASARDL